MRKESVKIDTLIVNLVRSNKETTGVPVGKFFEQAAVAKLAKIRSRNAEKVGGKRK